MKRVPVALALTCLLAVSACGGGEADTPAASNEPSAASDQSPSTSTTEPPATPTTTPAAEAMSIAEQIRTAVPEVTQVVEITEDNDPNDTIGRPGSYVTAAVLYDSRVECPDPASVDIDCGAKVEVFQTAEAAQARVDYIAGLIETMGSIVTEYDYVSGTVVLRVAGAVKPSEAAAYEAAFAQISP